MDGEITIILVKKKPIENMSEMFSGCSSLLTVRAKTQWITDTVTDMSSMLYECNNLKYFRVLDLNTSKVKNFSKIFYNCKSLLVISRELYFNTENAENLKEMFYGCESLKNTKGTSDWNTAKVIDMSYMFFNCKKIEELDLSKWDFPRVKYLSGMFKGCNL